MLRILVFLSQWLFIGLGLANVGLHGDDDLYSFVTRPDLKSPKWNVEWHNRKASEPGYWFVTPFNLVRNNIDDIKWTPCQVGPMIYDNEGELVWSGACKFSNRISFDFKVSDFYDDEGMALTGTLEHADNDNGIGWFLGKDYEEKHTLVIEKRPSFFNFHEFNVIDNGRRALVSTRAPTKVPGHEVGVKEDVWINLSGFQERDTKTGDILFEWQATDHISLNESSFDPDELGRPGLLGFTEANIWDAYHVNSIDKNGDGDYLVSFRHTDQIFSVSGKDGHVLWRAGGKQNDFILEDGLSWSRQHHARYVSYSKDQSIITLFDNAAGMAKQDSQPPTSPSSRGLVLELNHKKGKPFTARVLRQYDRPDGELATRRGSMQILPGGNIFLAWTDGGYLSEHTKDGKVVMEARFLDPQRLGTYRVYKQAWIGEPSEPPVAKATSYRVDSDFFTTIHVSWNGATEVQSWNFYSGRTLLGNAKKIGFETSFATKTKTGEVWVEGLDLDGNVLGASKRVTTEISGGKSSHNGNLGSGATGVWNSMQRYKQTAADRPYWSAVILVLLATFGFYVLLRMALRNRWFASLMSGYKRLSDTEV